MLEDATPATPIHGSLNGSLNGSARMVFRTGAEQPWDPEDYAIAKGQDPTPKNVERARRELAEWGAAAIERTVP